MYCGPFSAAENFRLYAEKKCAEAAIEGSGSVKYATTA
jgi:hypothetical protein